MNKIALCKSIEHWYDNWEVVQTNKLPHLGAKNCALCTIYIDNDCIGCPVFESSGLPGCAGTPYMDLVAFIGKPTIASLVTLKVVGPTNKWNKVIETVEKEYAFLVSLLP